MICDELREAYELHALGLLEDPERAEIEAHLRRGCETCTAGVRRAAALNTQMLALAPDVRPSPKLRRKVLASVGARESRWAWMTGWPAAFAAMLIAVVYLGVQDRRKAGELAEARRFVEASATELTQMRAALALLNEPETRHVVFGQGQPQPPKGRVFVHNRRGVLLLASNLPPLPRGKTYELWTIPKGGAPRPAGLFQSDARGNALYLSPGPVDVTTLSAIAVSVEPEAGSSAPTTTPLIVAALTD